MIKRRVILLAAGGHLCEVGDWLETLRRVVKHWANTEVQAKWYIGGQDDTFTRTSVKLEEKYLTDKGGTRFGQAGV